MATTIDKDKLNSTQIVFKISERCNLTCSYCYVFYKGDESWRSRPPVVPRRTIEGLVSFLRAHAEDGATETTIVLHGGEPLLLKRSNFEHLCQSLRADGLPKVQIVMQTNATLIDEDWIDVFERHDVGVGVSIDGPKDVHDVYRLDKKGRGTYDQTKRGWDLCVEAADKGRIGYPGLLTVVQPDLSGRDVLDGIMAEFAPRGINFLEPDHTHDEDISSAYKEAVGRFLIEAIDAWFDIPKADRPRFRLLDEVMVGLANDEANGLSVTNKHDFSNLMTVFSNGTIATEDTLHFCDDRFKRTPFTVFNSKPSDVMGSKVWQELSRAAQRDALPDGSACRDCLWWSVCKGGRPVHRYSSADGLTRPSVYCDALKSVYMHIASIMVTVGLEPTAIERTLRRSVGDQPAIRF